MLADAVFGDNASRFTRDPNASGLDDFRESFRELSGMTQAYMPLGSKPLTQILCTDLLPAEKTI